MKFVDMTVFDFVDEVASESQVPGGGSVAALTGALAASLCSMVANLTITRKKYQISWEAMTQVKDQATELISEFKSLVDFDTQAYKQVLKAFKLPKTTPEELEKRNEALQDAIKGAAMVPLETLNAVGKLLELVVASLEIGNPNCTSDAGTALQLAKAAAMSASYSVRVNLNEIHDEEFVYELKQESEQLVNRICQTVSSMEIMLNEKIG